MAQTAKAPRQNRTLTVDFHDEATYSQLLGDTKAFIEWVLTLISSRSALNSTTNRLATAAAL
jgi:hypothetical protein